MADAISRDPAALGGSDVGANEQARRLIMLARQNSEQGRRELYRAIGDLFGNEADVLNPNERRMMLDILRRLSRDVEIRVRAALAKRLAVRPDAPRDLIMMLARDAGEVAHDILVRSSVLRDPDLIELVRHHTWRHQMAVAIRNGIGEDVCRALAKTGNSDVVVALLNNRSAHISAETFSAIAEESRDVEAYQGPLVRREDLPRELAERMLAWVSAALRHEIVHNFEIDSADLDDAIADAMHDVAAADSARGEGRDPSERLIEKLHAAGELTPAFAFGALQQGRIRLFELTLAKLAELRPVVLRRMLYETGGGGGLAMVCRALDIDRAAYAAVLKLRAHGRDGSGARDDGTVARLLNFYDDLSLEGARLALRRWRHDSALKSARHFVGTLNP